MAVRYDQIGIGYNTTRKADPYIARRIKHYLDPESGKTYLDIGCGTGNYTKALAQNTYDFIGVDPSMEMLDKAKESELRITWKKGIVEDIPLEDSSIDGAIAILTIHHWESLEKGIRELARVLRPGADLVMFTSAPEQMQTYWLNHYFPTMMKRSTLEMPSMSDISEALSACGLTIEDTEKYYTKEDLEDLFLQSGKHHPEIYFDEKVRNGISSFRVFCPEDELHKGLNKLRADIESKEIESVIRSFEGDRGDYLIIHARKDS